jgi:hypothetical protein
VAAVLAAACSASATPGDPPSQRAEFLEVARRLREGSNIYYGEAALGELRARLAAEGLEPAQRIAVRGSLALELLRMGEVDAGIESIEIAIAEVGSQPAFQAQLPGLLRTRALAYLRKAEIENCVRRHNRDCCIFPLRGGGLHAVREPGRKAIESYTTLLRSGWGGMKERWLLNIASMAVGEHPEGVPEEYLIPPAAFASETEIGRFVDVAPELGIDTFNLAGGVIADDLDDDGFIDIVTSTVDPEGPLTFYRNLGDGRFEDRSVASRLDEQLGGLNCVGADYDNDGDVDVLVTRGGWLKDDGRIRNSLLRNDGDLTFTDVTRQAGLADPARPTQTAAWGDFDNDGDLDLYVGNESRVTTVKTSGEGDYPSQLFRNDGGVFHDVAALAGVTNDRMAKGIAAGDYDNDGDLDIYVSNIGKNRLYRNEGNLRFRDVAEQAGVTEPRGRSFASWFFDYDNDGWLDLWVGAFDATIEDVAADYLGVPDGASRPRLYRNNGNGTFTDQTSRLGLDHAWLPMGANFGDLDNDGWLDIYLGTGDPNFQTLMPNVLLRNDRAERFQDVTTSAGVGHLQKGHGVAFVDLDNDGDQDIYHQLGGFYPGDKFANAFFLNPGHGHAFLTVELVGVESNRMAYGARLRVTVDTPRGPRAIHRAVGAVSSFGGSPARQEIGLGDATGIVELEVQWPKSGRRQTFGGLTLQSAVRVREGQDRVEPLVFRVVPLGRSSASRESSAQGP